MGGYKEITLILRGQGRGTEGAMAGTPCFFRGTKKRCMSTIYKSLFNTCHYFIANVSQVYLLTLSSHGVSTHGFVL